MPGVTGTRNGASDAADDIGTPGWDDIDVDAGGVGSIIDGNHVVETSEPYRPTTPPASTLTIPEMFAAPPPLVAPPAPPIHIPGLRQVKFDDVSGLARMLQNIWRVREVWTDDALANPGQWFMSHYANPYNLVFDVEDGQGFIAFLHTVPCMYSNVYFAAWGRRAMRRVDLWRAAAQVAMLSHDLLVINGFNLPENKRARRMALSCGMRERGLIRHGASYAGVARPWVWYDIERPALGLPPITADEP